MSPKVNRKYPSEQKTTTVEGKREYQKLQMRACRERQKVEVRRRETAKLSQIHDHWSKRKEFTAKLTAMKQQHDDLLKERLAEKEQQQIAEMKNIFDGTKSIRELVRNEYIVHLELEIEMLNHRIADLETWIDRFLDLVLPTGADLQKLKRTEKPQELGL